MLAVIPQTTAAEMWESEHAGVQREARPLHLSVYWNAPSREDDVPRQVEIVNHAVEQNVAGIILSPDHAVALVPPVRAALEHGIPTVILGASLDISSSPLLAFVQNDEAEAAQLVFARIADRLQPGDVVAILGVNPNLPTSLSFADQLEANLRRVSPDVVIRETRSTSFSLPEAETAAEELIRTSPHLRYVVSLSANQTRGALQALASTGAARHVPLIGIDQDLDLMLHLRAGDIDAIVAKRTSEMGAAAVRMIHQHMLQRPMPPLTIMRPVLVTRDNVDTPEVQGILNMDWRGQ